MKILSIDARRAAPHHASGIANVHAHSWRMAYSGIIPHKALDRMIARRDESWWARAIRHSTRIVVIEDQDTVVGYATLGPNRVSALPQDGEIYELYLLPEYQGVGLGKKLFLAARQELINSGMKGAVVWVLEENFPAMEFYRNAGGQDLAEGSETFDDKPLKKIAFCWN
ncbi:GNAT family N-acetyltransferase [Pseudahrensia aquimaris]|uniref:GNAT family N-acetyltransferase n=1 Tax=Pseudahrensia aquimaris TaxID=744461 RepID=A0ABW3FFL4_9HYPH